MQTALVLLVLFLTYIGMAAGRIAWLQVDRTGIALLAVITLLASGEMTLDDFGSAVDMPTLALLFAMMIISAQFAESGFIERCARMIVERPGGERRSDAAALLALTVVIGGGLSAVLANDILIITIAPALIQTAQRRGLDPRPFTIALAASANAGSAATLIGNPQNILLGAIGRLDFWTFLYVCGVPALVALGIVFVVVWLQWHRHILADPQEDAPPPTAATTPAATTPAANPTPVAAIPAGTAAALPVSHPLDRNQTIKGVVAILVLLGLFATPLPREIGALIIAALLLANRKITSRTMIATVDWPLLLFVSCLFAITGQLNDTGVAARVLGFLAPNKLLPNNLLLLFPFAAVTSNTIGSVSSAILLLQIWPNPPAGVFYALSLLSTLAGSLLLSGSLTNLLIAERAERMGARLSYRQYARAGVPITLCSLAFAVLWLAALHILPITPPPPPSPPL